MDLACQLGSEACLACPTSQQGSFCLSEPARVWEHPVELFGVVGPSIRWSYSSSSASEEMCFVGHL